MQAVKFFSGRKREREFEREKKRVFLRSECRQDSVTDMNHSDPLRDVKM